MSTPVTDILELIDNALDGWHGTPDAMRWTPPTVEWDEPIVRSPRTPVEHLAAAGWDGYAASAYPPIALRQMLRALSEAIENVGRAFGQFMPAAERILAVQRATEAKSQPFWTVQPQRERRKR